VIAALAGVAVAVALAYAFLLLRRALHVAPSALDAALVRRTPAAKVDSLDRAEGLVVIALSNAGDVHWRLRPVLRDIAGAALHGRGVDLDGEAAAARALLGEEAWELVRADRPRPDDTFAPGVPPAELDRVLAVLEDLQR
jgi:hypothetical protein